MNSVDKSSYFRIINSARYQAWVENCNRLTGNDYSGYEKGLFEEYLETELKYEVDDKYTSMSVDDLLNMKIKDGKLVNPDEEESEETTDETAEETNAEITEEAPEQTTTEDGENNKQLYGDDPAIEMGEQSIANFINDLLGEDEYIELLDTDKSGDISTEEAQAFINAIKGLDGDKENVSLEDVLEAMKDVHNNEFTLDPEEVEIKEEEIAEAKESEQSNDTQVSGGVSGGGYGGGTSGNVKSNETKEKNLDNMSKEELETELSSAQSDLDDKNKILSEVLDGSTPELEKLKDAEDEAYEAYQEELKNVDEDMAKQLDDLKSSVDDKEAEIDAKELEISNQKSVVSDCETAYDNSVSTTQTLKTSLEALKSVDTSDLDSEKQAELNSKIAELEAEIQESETNEDIKKGEWDTAEDDLSDLEDEKDTLEGELEELNNQMTDLEDQIKEKYPEIKEYMDNYEQAKKDYNSQKQLAVTKAENDVEKAQNYVNDVNTAISNYDDKEKAKEYSFKSDFQAAVDWARQYDDWGQGKMIGVFQQLGYRFDYDLWCADFVAMALSEGMGYENLPEWYQNCQNKASCPSIQHAGEGHKISIDEAQPGDIVLYDWNGDGSADHVGLFVSGGDGVSNITAIEGNTWGAGGTSCVEETERKRSCILGVYSMRD